MKLLSRAGDSGSRDYALANSGMIPATALGLALYAITCGIFYVLHRSGVDNATFRFLEERLFQRGTIPHFLSAGFFIGIALLLIRIPLLARENVELRQYRSLLQSENSFGPAELQAFESEYISDNDSLVANHLSHVITRARTAASGAELDAGMEQISEIERRRIDASHVPVRYLIWLIPTLGFLGTVLGISMAVGGFSDVITKTAGTADLQKNLVEICRELGVAFDTTFLALVYSAVIAFLMAFIDKWEIKLSNDLDDLCASVLRPRLSHIIGHDQERPIAPIALPAAAPLTTQQPAGNGHGGGGMIVLKTTVDDVVSLSSAAESAVVNALTELAGDGRAVVQALGDSSAALRLSQFVEANLAQLREQREWLNSSAIRREEVAAVIQAMQAHSARMERMLTQLAEQSKLTADAVNHLAPLLQALLSDGVKSRVIVQSSVAPAQQ